MITLLDEESSTLLFQGLKERENPGLRLTRGEGRKVILLRWMVFEKLVAESEIAMDAQKLVMATVAVWTHYLFIYLFSCGDD